MSRTRKVILVIFLILLGIVVGAVYYFTGINPPKDSAASKKYPSEFFCDGGENRIDFQTDNNCSAYAAAYVLRSMGEQTDGEKVAAEMNRIFGFVPAKSIVSVFEKHGFWAKAYRGNVDTLKQRLANGVPIIVFVSIPGDTHYAVVVGYDQQYFYLVDSLAENKNVDASQYNRKLKTEEFEKIWRTNTVLSDNIYIVVDKLDENT